MKNAIVMAILLAASAIAASAQTAHYQHDGKAVLPDPQVTPGAVSDRTAKQLCAAGFHTGTVRAVSESTKKAVCAEYGVSPCDGHVEIDHLISLEIGGTNDQTNLWPQPYHPISKGTWDGGAKQKDVLENALHKMVCDGKISLGTAQKCIAKDWFACGTKYGLFSK